MTNEHELERLEDLLGRVLVIGTTLSAGILGAGLVASLAGADPHGLLRLGLLLLMGTPILRVVVSFVEYLRLRDWFFASTAAAVLLVLLTSILVAMAG